MDKHEGSVAPFIHMNEMKGYGGSAGSEIFRIPCQGRRAE